ncbi:ribosome-binding protein aMBF1, putative translation factor, contains Zn-ribbon and HTH domains [Halogranum amylolyticum]|uniref:Ribosome-binding protein aMBF1, putative translation factor, contains Zn-ribbon and HTH domains n=1 Tax=Halogranum amylolyticum TaxID=660520 RepID=A0A1H8RZ81_9EURY|nr:multiprotein-bridging factor 1 family protein [Halogranum amylolyticum]SEO71514.1 ribosome-binding protein aMBF1, putative translation factor, contains Zn-ribbon and HTH domains [Halogranum amylolyticum]
MAKYSTGRGGGGDDGDACELCGKQSGRLRQANVAGATLLVCPDCAPHGENRNTDRKRREQDQQCDDTQVSRKKRAAQTAAKMYDAQKGDAKHWEEEGTNYEKDRLPYLVSDYGPKVEAARQEAGLTVEELAAELDVDEDDVRAVEQGRATRAGVGGSVVRKLESRLDLSLVDE